MMMTTRRVFMGTRLAASVHRRCAAEDAIETTVIYVMSSAAKMRATELKTGTKIGSVKSKKSAMKGTMITMVLAMTHLTKSGQQKWDISQEASRCTLET
jgi:hypothetical protein